MSDVVLDASAVLAVLGGEPGADNVAAHIPGAKISAVNLAEVASVLSDRTAGTDVPRQLIRRLGLQVIPFTESVALVSGELRRKTRSFGLSLGDRACLALAQILKLPVLTGDRVWAGLELGIEVRVIR